MNTKGIKFLAVLAVMALAFAAFVALAPAENDDSIVVFGNNNVDCDIAVYTTSTVTNTTFYVSEDATVKIKDAAGAPLTFYVQNGKTLELDIKADQTNTISIFTVTGDQEMATTSYAGKFILNDNDVCNTEFTFTGLAGQGVYYKAAVGSYYVYYDGTSFEGIWTTTTNAMVGADKAFDAVPTVGKNVTVAEGQTIVVNSASEISNLNYGVYYKDTSGATTVGTYYAPKNNAGSINFLGDEDQVKVKSGSVTVTNGSTVVKASSITGKSTAPVQIDAATDGLTVSGQLTKGDVTLSGSIAADGFVNNGGNVTLANKIDLTSSTINNTKGNLYVKAGDELLDESGNALLTVTGAGTVIAQNTKLWSTTMTTSLIIDVEGVTGLVDTSAITKVAEVKKDFSDTEIATNQTFEMVDTTTIYQQLVVKGIVIVDEGVTLTIDEGASITTDGKMSQIINNGRIIVKAKGNSGEGLFINGGALINNGTIDFTAKSNNDRTGETFGVSEDAIAVTNNGTITVSKSDIIVLASGFTNNGTFNLNGKVIGATEIINKGKVIINGAIIDDAITTKLATKGATVAVSSMKMTTSGVFMVEDSMMKDSNLVPGESIVTLTTNADETTIRGLTFTAATDGYYKTPTIDLKGSIGVAIPTSAGADAAATIGMEGNILVSSNLTIPKKTNVAITTSGVAEGVYINVPGTMSTDKAVELTEESDPESMVLDVSGRVVTGEDIFNGCTYHAAKYMDGEAAVYTTLNEAIDEAQAAEILSIELGPITITEDVIIPAEMSVDAGDWAIGVGDGFVTPTVYIQSSGRLSASLITIYSGAIYAEEASDINGDDVVAHVVTEGAIVEDDILFESLGVALSHASAGDLIELSSDFVMYNDSITIPAGVTVDATANTTDFVLVNSNMFVEGTLITNVFYFVAQTDDTIGIEVDGFMKDIVEAYLTPHWFTPVGVSYSESTIDPRGEEVTYFVITSLDNLQDAIYAADDSKVTVEGKAKLGNVTIKGTEDEPAEVTFNEDISAGTITIENATLIAKSGKQISAAIEDEYGKITIRGAYVGGENKIVKIYSLGEDGVYMSGPIRDKDNGTYSILFEGKTGMNNATIGWGYYATEPVAYPTVTFAGQTLATGNKNVIANYDDEATNEDAGIVTISGSLTADNGSKILIIADVDVLGTLDAVEKTSTSTNGTVEVEGNIFLGATKASIYDARGVLAAYGYFEDGVATYGHQAYDTSATAALAGKIVVAEDYFITALSGSSIDESIIEDMKSMDVVIDGKLWLTVYGTAAYSMDGLKAPIKDCTVDKIYNADGDEIASFSQKYGVIYGSPAADLDSIGTAYITLDYKIFTVCIKTDASIKAVYIDGILMYTQDVANQFYSYRVEAGTHTVTVEPATGYTADKAYLYTEMGTLLQGLKFTFSEDDCIPGTYTVVYNVAGTEKITEVIPEPEQVSEWTITTILLLVLVVLIAIMAVIVALRLNRS